MLPSAAGNTGCSSPAEAGPACLPKGPPCLHPPHLQLSGGWCPGHGEQGKNVTPPLSCHHAESEGQSHLWLFIYLLPVCAAHLLSASPSIQGPVLCGSGFLNRHTGQRAPPQSRSEQAEGSPALFSAGVHYQATQLSLCRSPQDAQTFGRKCSYIPGPASAMVLSNETALGPVLIEDRRQNQGCGARTFRAAPPSLQLSGGSGKDGGSKPLCGFLEKRQTRMESRQCRPEPAHRSRDLTRANHKTQVSAKAHANLN